MEAEGFNASVGLFQVPPTETGEETVSWVNIRPTSQITSGGVIDFTVPGNTLQYMNCKKTLLYVKSKVVKKDGSDIVAEDIVTTINLFLHSLWSQMEVSIQQKSISSGISTRYPYKAILDIILFMKLDERKSKGPTMMYYRDSGRSMDSVSPSVSPVNTGLFSRNERCKVSKIFDMQGPLYSDFFQQNRLLLNGVQLSVRLYPTSDAFRLMSAKAEYKVEILDAILKVCYVKVSPGILLGHSEALKVSPARYFFDDSVIKTYAIAQGEFSITADDLFQGEVPKRLILTLISSDSLNGSFSKNPFNFKNYDLNFCGFYIDGQSLPTQPLQPDFDNDLYTEAYLTALNEMPLNGLSFDEFKAGYSIYIFDIKQTAGDVLSVRKKGHTRLEIRFSKALPEPATLLVYAKFDKEMRIDESRSVTLI
jgi:hypothetical protein